MTDRTYAEAVAWIALVGYRPVLGQLVAYLYEVNVDEVRQDVMASNRRLWEHDRH
ncbi:MAG: hypothetical protein ACRDHG_04640 [Anaerolineales bacterium]